MFFIFGWGHRKVQDHGRVARRLCPHCRNDEPWQLLTVSEWITLFFIPVIPTSRKHLTMCPICGYAIELDGAALEEARRLARL